MKKKSYLKNLEDAYEQLQEKLAKAEEDASKYQILKPFWKPVYHNNSNGAEIHPFGTNFYTIGNVICRDEFFRFDMETISMPQRYIRNYLTLGEAKAGFEFFYNDYILTGKFIS